MASKFGLCWRFIVFAVLVLAGRVYCQTADSFNPGVDRGVHALAVQPDGKVLVGGLFSSLGGQPRAKLGRLQPDGNVDLTFNPEAVTSAYVLAVQPDGKLLVGGSFVAVSGQPPKYLGRLNPDGTLDSSFNAAPKYPIVAVTLQPDGKILVGGSFIELSGQTRISIDRLNRDGSLDLAFRSEATTLAPPSPAILALAVQPDGKVLVGGSFAYLGGYSRQNVGRLYSNGAVDITFNPGANQRVDCLAVQADGQILVGGEFNSLGGRSCNYLGRLNRNGSLDTNFSAQVELPVSSLVIQADGKVLAGWRLARNCIRRLNPDGTLDTNFNVSISGGAPPSGSIPSVNALAVQKDGKILLGGSFTAIAGEPRASIGRLNNTEHALERLSLEGSSVIWLRSGTCPEVWHTTFETSVNGLNWSSLEAGTRIPGGWRVSAVSVPPNSTIRARGFVVVAGDSASQWFAESTCRAVPFISVNDGSFGFRSNQFGFNLIGGVGWNVVLEASSNLVDWTAVSTNSVGNGPFYFADPASANAPRQFYRALTR